jgi:hypothetical protein
LTVKLTLAIDENVLREARKLAFERSTTVNQLIRDFLADLVSQEGRRGARERLKASFSSGITEIGELRWNRDELHQRS